MISNSYYSYHIVPWLKSEFPDVVFTDYIHAHDWSWRNGGYPRDSVAISNFLDKTYTCNNYVKNVMINEMNRKKEDIETVYIGVDTNEFNPENVDELDNKEILNRIKGKKVILYLCRIVELKRPIFMLKVLEKVLENDKDFILLVVGDGEQLNEMKKYAKELNLQENVVFCGMQKNTKSFYKLANVSVICSLTEGLALTSYESLSMGVPVITSDVGGQSELIDDSCGKVIKTYQDVSKDLFNRNYDIEEIVDYANAILEIVNSKDYNKIKDKCREKILSEFSVSRMVEIIDNSFSELIHNGTQVNKEILNNKEFSKQYLVLYNAVDNRNYHTDKGGKTTKKDTDKMANLRDRLWANPLYRLTYRILKKLGIWDVLKKNYKREGNN